MWHFENWVHKKETEKNISIKRDKYKARHAIYMQTATHDATVITHTLRCDVTELC